jgi:hypothetical protein
MNVSDDWGGWSWGPDQRGAPAATPVVTAALAGIIVVLLLAGVAGVVVHHGKGTKAGATPPGFQRVTDVPDHMSLAVPSGWQVLAITSGQLSSQLAALKISHPELSSVLDVALASLRQVQPGAFAVDVPTHTTLFSYGVNAPGIQSLSDIPVSDVVAPFTAIGAKNVHTSRVHLLVGDAEQVTAQLPVGTLMVTEVLDYFVRNHRVTAVVLAVRGTAVPTGLFHQIETTLAPAP